MKLNYPEIRYIYLDILDRFSIINWECDDLDDMLITLLFMEVSKRQNLNKPVLHLKYELVYEDLFSLNRERKLKKLKRNTERKRI